MINQTINYTTRHPQRYPSDQNFPKKPKFGSPKANDQNLGGMILNLSGSEQVGYKIMVMHKT